MAPNPSRNASEARGGRRCARLRRAGAGESGEQLSREGRGHRVVKLSIADGTALRNIVGEEVAATFGDTEDLSPRALCLCRYAPPATYSPALPAFYLSVLKKMSERRDDRKT